MYTPLFSGARQHGADAIPFGRRAYDQFGPSGTETCPEVLNGRLASGTNGSAWGGTSVVPVTHLCSH